MTKETDFIEDATKFATGYTIPDTIAECLRHSGWSDEDLKAWNIPPPDPVPITPEPPLGTKVYDIINLKIYQERKEGVTQEEVLQKICDTLTQNGMLNEILASKGLAMLIPAPEPFIEPIYETDPYPPTLWERFVEWFRSNIGGG